MQASSSSVGTLRPEDKATDNDISSHNSRDLDKGDLCSKEVFKPSPANVSSRALRDLEKGDIISKENNEVNQDNFDTQKTQEDSNLVGWDGPKDPGNPQNWPNSKKYLTTVFYATLTFCLTFSSSIFSTATMVTAKLFGVSPEVMILGTSLFVLVRVIQRIFSSC